jgi:hypothetical protein
MLSLLLLLLLLLLLYYSCYKKPDSTSIEIDDEDNFDSDDGEDDALLEY